MGNFSEYLKITIGLLAIVNPIGAIPIFISLTSYQTRGERIRAATITATAVTAILFAALILGEPILRLFGISMGSFRIAGGILILLMALSMFHASTSRAKQTQDEAEEAEVMDSVAVVPMAMPLLAGPGAISTVIVYVHRAPGVVHYIATAAAILVVGLAVFMALRTAPFLSERVSRTGINIVTRILGLILAAIAVEFIVNGVRELFPGLA